MISGGLMGTEPNFSTSSPAAVLASVTASTQVAPAARATASIASTMSPAPATS